LEEPLKGFFGT
jgi:hypothetical protein